MRLLSRGELYTIVTNKAAKGGKGAIFAMIRGTKADDIVKIINTIPRRVHHICKEITMDFAVIWTKMVGFRNENYRIFAQ